ncbi:tripartite tricarboxylate transporter substrate binding protein [Achromobacter sp. D10]|jgi:tripartite-type tricarboxylate transporter receptor subunit TctC|uniref:Bug family tripartite tricarboxylate transporter substrate binding protein n=1 Tax=Achromobacter sp. D10 TaxID=3110765 RepID=UPI002B459030|nr:tripartite tricarboxylate transporter substrate binding protein [Achromobacter sp. D10]MEB3098412.1 tripartite tricarboxylate transporter substrate binding protein [Achromobacter sp. D10]
MIRNILRRGALGALLVSSLGAGAARADYPDHPVTVVVAFAPGGMTDIVARLLSAELGKRFNQTFVVENKPGAAGQIGTELVARQKNDGYTLLVSATGHVIGPAVNDKVRYDPVKDFEPISILARAPNLVVVNAGLPVKTIPEFLSWGRAQPGVPYGSAGFGGSTHLGGEWLKKITGVPMEHVPYKGASPATNAVVSGELKVAVQDAMSVAPFIKSGQLRPIGVASAERSKLFPDLPTFAESGAAGLDVYTWLGFYAPAGTDPAIVAKLNQATSDIMNSPEMVQRLAGQNSEPLGPMTPKQVSAFVADETAKWRNVVQTTGVKVE